MFVPEAVELKWEPWETTTTISTVPPVPMQVCRLGMFGRACGMMIFYDLWFKIMYGLSTVLVVLKISLAQQVHGISTPNLDIFASLKENSSGSCIHQRSKIVIFAFDRQVSACDSQGHLQTSILPVTFASHGAWKSWDGDVVKQTDGQEFAKPAAELSEAAAGGATVWGCFGVFLFPQPSDYRLGQCRCPHFRWAAEWRSQIVILKMWKLHMIVVLCCVVLCCVILLLFKHPT